MNFFPWRKKGMIWLIFSHFRKGQSACCGGVKKDQLAFGEFCLKMECRHKTLLSALWSCTPLEQRVTEIQGNGFFESKKHTNQWSFNKQHLSHLKPSRFLLGTKRGDVLAFEGKKPSLFRIFRSQLSNWHFSKKREGPWVYSWCHFIHGVPFRQTRIFDMRDKKVGVGGGIRQVCWSAGNHGMTQRVTTIFV